MKIVVYEDENGRKQASYLRNSDPDTAAKSGIPVSLPLDELDIEELIDDLRSLLIERRLFTQDDVAKAPDSLRQAVVKTISNPLYRAYRANG